MKKLLALVLVAIMVFSCLVFASCGDKKEDTSTASENSIAPADESKTEESATSTDESTASADESATSEDATSEDATSEDTTSEDATSEDVSTEVPEEIKATATYKFFQTLKTMDLTKGFTSSMTMDGQKTNFSLLGNSIYAEVPTDMGGVSVMMKIIAKDGKTYAINDTEKSYVVLKTPIVSEDVINEITGLLLEFTEFGGYEFVSTTTEEVEGVTYTVETFKAEAEADLEKYYIDDKGAVAFVIDKEGTSYVEFDGIKLFIKNGEDEISFEAGVPEGIFDIPADYTEVTVAQ